MARKTKHLILWISDDDHAAYDALAKLYRVTKAELTRNLLNRGLRANPEMLGQWKACKRAVTANRKPVGEPVA